MEDSPIALAHQALVRGMELLSAASDASADPDSVLSALTICEGATRRLDHLLVTRVGDLTRRGVFAERGYDRPAAALSDLLGWDSGMAGRRVKAADQIGPRVGLDGQVLPPRLPATAAAFALAAVSMRHVETIVRELNTPAARRLDPGHWAGVEQELADKASSGYTPAELADHARSLITLLDQDGAGEPEDAPEQVNRVTLSPHTNGSGGRINGDLDALSYEAVSAAIAAGSTPLTADDHRGLPERQADALAEICGYVLDHGDDVLPRTGGERPHLNVQIGIEELERRARSAMLDFGSTLTPGQLRMLACDARVVPIVMNGASQPLDVGRATRIIPDGLRRAVAARDRGCAHGGCRRPPSWCEVHHVIPWESGGVTALHNCVMLCRFHHRLMHKPGWSVQFRDGRPEFIPPTWIDPEQKPRRKPVIRTA